MLPILGFFVSFIILPFSQIVWQGEVVFSNPGGLLVKTQAGEKAVLLGDDTLFINIAGSSDLIPGLRIKVTVKKVQGLPLAQEIEALPYYHASPSKEIFLKPPLKDIIPVDCQSREAFEKIHLPGAIWLPEKKRDDPSPFLPPVPGKTYVLYGYNRQSPEPFRLLAPLISREDVKIYPEGLWGWNQVGGVFETHQLYPFKEMVLWDLREGGGESLKCAQKVTLKNLHWRDFTRPTGMPPQIVVGEEEDAITLARKIVHWRHQQAVVTDGPVMVFKGSLNKAYRDLTSFPCESSVEGALTPQEALALAKKDPQNTLWVDLRFPPHPLPKGFLSLPLEFLEDQFQRLPKDKKLILFCSKGHRAKIAYKILHNLGYSVQYLPTSPPF